MSNNVGGANIEITADDRQAQSTFTRFSRFLESLGRKSKGFANSGFAFFQRMEEKVRAAQSVLEGTERVLTNMNQRLTESTSSFKEFNEATNNIQAQKSFSEIEKAIRRTRTELSMLGFGKTKAEIEATEAAMYQFANRRMDTLQDEIKQTERALEQLKNSADASKYTEQIKKAEEALKQYKKELADAEPIKKMAEVNGYAVQKIFGKDVIVKPIIDNLQRVKAQIAGFINTDLAWLANKTYQVIDNAAKAIVGSADTIEEQRRKINRLASAYQRLGTTINTMVTPYIAAATIGLGILASKFEEMSNRFQGRTLTPNAEMREFNDLMVDTWVKTGESFSRVGDTFSYLKNQLGETRETIKQTAIEAITLAQKWDLKNEEVAQSIRDIETETGAKRPQVLDMFALSLKKNQGDIQKAKEEIKSFFPLFQKLTAEGRKAGLNNAEIAALAQKKVKEELLEQNEQYESLNEKAEKLKKQIAEAKTPKEEVKLRERLKEVTDDISKAQEEANKQAAEYTKQQIAAFKELEKYDGSKAFETVQNAEGSMKKLGQAMRGLVASLLELFEALAPTLTKIAEGLTAATKAATEFLRNNPGFASFVAHMLAAGAAATVLIGAFAPVAAFLIRFRGVFKDLAIDIKAFSTGTKAVLSPTTQAIIKNMNLMRDAVAGLPKILAGALPALLTMLRTLPIAVGKFALSFVKLNPMLTVFSLLATVIIDNWDRVGSVLSQIWKDVLLAFKPVVQAFQDANGSVWPTVQKALESISRIAGTVLVDALKTIEPVIRGIAAVINGDLKGAVSAFGDFESSFQSVGSLIGGVALAWGAYTLAVKTSSAAMIAHIRVQSAMKTASELMALGVTRATGAMTALRLAFISNPIGLAITGLSLAAGAATLFANKTEEVKEVTLEQVDALNKQRGALENTIKEYESLRSSIKLSEPELLRYMDLQKQIAHETNPERQAVLKKELDELAKKSGVSVEHLQNFFKANSDLIRQAPETAQAISAEGEALAKSADAAKNLVAELAKKSQLELETQKANVDAQMTQNLEKYAQTIQRIKALEQERVQQKELIKQLENQVTQAEMNYQKVKQDGNFFEKRAAEERLNNLKGTLALERNTLVLKSQQQLEAQKELANLDQVFQKTKQIYQALIQRQAQQAGINAAVGKEVDAIDAVLKKHMQTRAELLAKQKAGKDWNAEQQKTLEKTDAEIKKLLETKVAIQNLQAEQTKVGKKIDEATGKATEMNKELGKKVEKPVDGKQIDDGKKKANELNKELQKPATKQVNVQVNDSPIKRLMDWLKTPFTKTINLVQSVTKQVKEIKLPSIFGGSNNPPKRHSGGTVHELPKFHSGGSPALMGTPPKSNEVDVRLLRNEMVLTKEQQANLFNMIRTFKGVVAKRVASAKAVVEGANKIIAQAAQKLAAPKEEEAVISQTLAEIKKNAAAASKGGNKQQQRTTDNKAFTEAMKTAQFKFDKGVLNAQQYITVLREIDKQYAKLPEHHRQVSEKISKTQENLTKIVSEQAKKQFESSKKWIDEKKYYNQLSLEQELAAWERVAARLQEGTEERIEAEREIYRVKQEMERASFENSKRWIEEKKYYNELSLEEELAAWERVQKRYKLGTVERKEADREVYRVRVELATKAIEEEYKQTIEAIDRATKTVQEAAERQKEAIEQRRDAALNALKREEQAELDSIDRRQKAYERSHQERIKMLDDETNAAIKRLQAEIDAIDRQGRDQEYAYKDTDRQKELAELRKQYDKYKVSASAKGQKKAADLLKQIEEIQTEIERDEQARRREQQKAALQEQINNIKEAAEQKKEQWQLEFERQKEWFEQEKQQRQSYYQQREQDLRASFDNELRMLEESTKQQLAQLEQQKVDAENTRNQMLEDAKRKAYENLRVVEQNQQQIVSTLQSKNREYYQSGQTLGNMFAYGLESSLSRVREAANRVARAVQDRLKLNSPAKEGPLSTLDRWWNAFADTLLEGLDTNAINAAMNAMVNPNLSFGSLGAVGAKAVAAGTSIKQEYNFERMFEGATFVIRDDNDIRGLGREFGSYVVNSTKTTDRARGRK
ncbi:hypothetical protein [Aneurinibacillus thermoaerophilus]|uniref:hypothetical protein n=1 Tax=Aneurinibacillus thermoaerophilus TaxID=143495 RepID=UPI002E1B1139|nr:hypothetical protein [Aneurinibacillus thermoaerophilus]